MKGLFFAVACIIIITLGCSSRNSNSSQELMKDELEPSEEASASSAKLPIDAEISELGYLFADTIIYEVLVKNPNPLDSWAEERLQYLSKRSLIDSLFDAVYKKELIAYDFFEETPLSIRDVEKIEQQFDNSRELIGKMQFTERWYYNPQTFHMEKEVLSIALGYENHTSSGEMIGYKPVFKLYLR